MEEKLELDRYYIVPYLIAETEEQAELLKDWSK